MTQDVATPLFTVKPRNPETTLLLNSCTSIALLFAAGLILIYGLNLFFKRSVLIPSSVSNKMIYIFFVETMLMSMLIGIKVS